MITNDIERSINVEYEQAFSRTRQKLFSFKLKAPTQNQCIDCIQTLNSI